MWVYLLEACLDSLYIFKTTILKEVVLVSLAQKKKGSNFLLVCLWFPWEHTTAELSLQLFLSIPL